MGGLRFHDELQHERERRSLNRVERLMKVNRIVGIPQKKRWNRKRSSPRPEHVDNHLQRDFQAKEENAKWTIDITNIRTDEGWLYLCPVMDLANGVIVGWSMKERQTRELVLDAVLMALWQRPNREPVILHSDRGCQFTSDEYQRFLSGHNLICSMSAVGSCADNTAMEGFFGLLKRERVNRRRYRTRAQARSDVCEYIERFHNPRRRRQWDQTRKDKPLFFKTGCGNG